VDPDLGLSRRVGRPAGCRLAAGWLDHNMLMNGSAGPGGGPFPSRNDSGK